MSQHRYRDQPYRGRGSFRGRGRGRDEPYSYQDHRRGPYERRDYDGHSQRNDTHPSRGRYQRDDAHYRDERNSYRDREDTYSPRDTYSYQRDSYERRDSRYEDRRSYDRNRQEKRDTYQDRESKGAGRDYEKYPTNPYNYQTHHPSPDSVLQQPPPQRQQSFSNTPSLAFPQLPIQPVLPGMYSQLLGHSLFGQRGRGRGGFVGGGQLYQTPEKK